MPDLILYFSEEIMSFCIFRSYVNVGSCASMRFLRTNCCRPRIRICPPDLISAMMLRGERPVFAAKVDLHCFYLYLSLPDWLVPYFALPSLTSPSCWSVWGGCLRVSLLQPVADIRLHTSTLQRCVLHGRSYRFGG